MDKYNIVSRDIELKFYISNRIYNDLIDYCEINGLNHEDIIKSSFISGFNIERYGLLNGDDQVKEIIKEVEIEKEVIKYIEKPIEIIKEVEVIKEVPIETIKEVEVIKEVPIEVVKEIEVEKEVIREVEVIKEVPVEKIVYISDEDQVNELVGKISELNKDKEELSQKLDTLEIKLKEKPNEIIKEVPVEVIKEVFVDKKDDSKSKLDLLQKTIQNLREDNIKKDQMIKELESKQVEINKFVQEQKAIYLRGSNLDDDKLYK